MEGVRLMGGSYDLLGCCDGKGVGVSLAGWPGEDGVMNVGCLARGNVCSESFDSVLSLFYLGI